MNKPLISIIMSCYNGEKFIERAVSSILKQTYQNWELIFWDNQSEDNSKAIVHEYNDFRIKYFYAPEHTLLSKARNYAIDNANGEYLAFLDLILIST